MEVGLHYWTTSDRTRGNVFKLCHGRCRLKIRKNLFSKGVLVRCCNVLPKEMVESPPMEAFKKCAHVVLTELI